MAVFPVIGNNLVFNLLTLVCMSKESTVKVSLDLNEELREYAVKRLAQFRT